MPLDESDLWLRLCLVLCLSFLDLCFFDPSCLCFGKCLLPIRQKVGKRVTQIRRNEMNGDAKSGERCWFPPTCLSKSKRVLGLSS